MAKMLEMPKLSPTMEEGVISAWHKREGEAFAVDDLLAEVETDKATMEFRAFDAGTLLKILAPAGAQVKLGQAVAIVGNAGEDVTALVRPLRARLGDERLDLAKAGAGGAAVRAEEPADRPPPQTSASGVAPPTNAQAPAREPAPAPEAARETSPPPAQRRPARAVASSEPQSGVAGSLRALDRTAFPPEREPPPAHDDGRVLASPYVRKVAREGNVELRGARGSGPGGRLLPSDVEAMRATSALVRTAPAGAAPATPALAPGLAEPEVRPLSQMRKAIARRLTESKSTVPHFYLSIDVDAGALSALRERINAELATADDGAQPLKVSINDLLVKACAVALRRVPECNASFTADAILVHRRVDVSVAVAIADGLVTPVVRDADVKSVAAIAREVKDLAARARAKKLKPEEMSNGTFSISNLGMFGIDEFAAVINPPEGAILAAGQVRDVPVVVDGAVVAGKKLALTLSCDHRVVDGAIGAAFLAELRRLLEHPLRVLAG